MHTGADAVAALSTLEPLLAATDSPVTASATWWRSWAASRAATWEPLLVTVGPEHDPRAAAPLAVRRGRGADRVVGWGHEESDRGALPALDRPAAEALAVAVAAHLRTGRRPWTLRVEQLPAADPVALALRQRLPAARVEVGDGCPQTPFQDDRRWPRT